MSLAATDVSYECLPPPQKKHILHEKHDYYLGNKQDACDLSDIQYLLCRLDHNVCK